MHGPPISTSWNEAAHEHQPYEVFISFEIDIRRQIHSTRSRSRTTVVKGVACSRWTERYVIHRSNHDKTCMRCIIFMHNRKSAVCSNSSLSVKNDSTGEVLLNQHISELIRNEIRRVLASSSSKTICRTSKFRLGKPLQFSIRNFSMSSTVLERRSIRTDSWRKSSKMVYWFALFTVIRAMLTKGFYKKLVMRSQT